MNGASRGLQKSSLPSLVPDNIFGRLFDEDLWMDTTRLPKLDITETDQEIKIKADVPGVNPEDLDVEVLENRLKISGRTERETKDDERPYVYERRVGEFYREFTLPTKVKEDQIKATCKDGVLTVRLPKSEQENERKKIKIERQ